MEQFPFNINVRLSVAHRAYLATIQQSEGISVSAALRLLLDELIAENAPDLLIVKSIEGVITDAA